MRLFALLGVCFTFVPLAQGQVRTINLDFGNGGAYSGMGPLSSLGGTFWNEVSVTEGSNGVPASAFLTDLKDEFGNAFNLPLQLPEVWVEAVRPVFGSGEGPLSDGVQLSTRGFNQIVFRELSEETPFEVVVFLMQPGDEAPAENAVVLFSEDFLGDVRVVSTVSSFFPGQEGASYLRWDGLSPVPTTAGLPTLPGFTLSATDLVGDGVAHIAAIQVRGEFVFTPEPSTGVMALLALVGAATRRRVTSAR